MVKLNFPHKFPEMCNVCCGLSWRDAGSPRRLRPLPLSLVGSCASCDNNNDVLGASYRVSMPLHIILYYYTAPMTLRIRNAHRSNSNVEDTKYAL